MREAMNEMSSLRFNIPLRATFGEKGRALKYTKKLAYASNVFSCRLSFYVNMFRRDVKRVVRKNSATYTYTIVLNLIR